MPLHLLIWKQTSGPMSLIAFYNTSSQQNMISYKVLRYVIAVLRALRRQDSAAYADITKAMLRAFEAIFERHLLPLTTLPSKRCPNSPKLDLHHNGAAFKYTKGVHNVASLDNSLGILTAAKPLGKHALTALQSAAFLSAAHTVASSSPAFLQDAGLEAQHLLPELAGASARACPTLSHSCGGRGSTS